VLILFIALVACTKKVKFPEIQPITVIKTIQCGDLVLEFKIEQILDPTNTDSNELKVTVANFSNNPQLAIADTTPVTYCIHFFEGATNNLNSIKALHKQVIDSLKVGDSTDTLISKKYLHEISSEEVQIHLLECKAIKSKFSGVYEGELLIPKFKNGQQDTVPEKARCLIDAQGHLKLWLNPFDSMDNFNTQTIDGTITDNGLFYGSAYNQADNFISYIKTDTNQVAPVSTSGKIQMNFSYIDRQVIFNADTCTNLIFNLNAI